MPISRIIPLVAGFTFGVSAVRLEELRRQIGSGIYVAPDSCEISRRIVEFYLAA